MRNITLRQLRALSQVVAKGSVAAAAKALHVTPPAVSLQLKLLEDAAGIALIDRKKTGMRPTDAGAEVLRAIARIDAALKECSDGIDALNGLGSGQVSVGVVSTAKYFAPRALSAFSQAHPNIDLKLSVNNRGKTIAALKDFAFDVVIMGRPPEDLELETAMIGEHPHIIVAAPDHPYAKRKRLRAKDLASELFLVRETGSGTRDLMQRYFAHARVEPRIGMEIDSNETIKQAVMAGLGISFISAHTVAAELGNGTLAAIPVAGLPVMRQWYLVKHSDRRLMPAGLALWQFLVAEGRQYLPRLPAGLGKPRRPARDAK